MCKLLEKGGVIRNDTLLKRSACKQGLNTEGRKVIISP